MVIALILTSPTFGIIGSLAAAYAGMGLMMCILCYVLGGMAGTVGFVTLTLATTTPDPRHAPRA